MAKIKLTKGELKRQRDSLKQFKRYLPTLQLKKQQLQMKVTEAQFELKKCQDAMSAQEVKINQWVGILVEADDRFESWAVPQGVMLDYVNVAGVNVPVLESVNFETPDYDLYETPLWVDKALNQLKAYFNEMAKAQVIEERVRRLQHELQITSQRVNLFEKVKIPECQENIRVIRIYLGDQQANAVGISKVAKKKLEGALV